MKITIRLIVLLTLGIFINCCDPIVDHSYGIRIRNNSSHSISVYGEYILPDTVLAKEKPQFRIIKSGESSIIYDREVDDLELERFKVEKLTIFILRTDTLNKYLWNDIVNDYKILKRYEINSANLVDLGGSITYP